MGIHNNKTYKYLIWLKYLYFDCIYALKLYMFFIY